MTCCVWEKYEISVTLYTYLVEDVKYRFTWCRFTLPQHHSGNSCFVSFVVQNSVQAPIYYDRSTGSHNGKLNEAFTLQKIAIKDSWNYYSIYGFLEFTPPPPPPNCPLGLLAVFANAYMHGCSSQGGRREIQPPANLCFTMSTMDTIANNNQNEMLLDLDKKTMVCLFRNNPSSILESF